MAAGFSLLLFPISLDLPTFRAVPLNGTLFPVSLQEALRVAPQLLLPMGWPCRSDDPGVPRDPVLGEGLKGHPNTGEPPPEGSVRPSRVLGSQETRQGVTWGQLHGFIVEAGRPLVKLEVGRARGEKLQQLQVFEAK